MPSSAATFAISRPWTRSSASYDIDTIVNFAAETHVDRSIMDADAFITTDVYGSYVLLEAANKHKLERLHLVSTDEVYGDVHEGSSVETDPLGGRSPYAASKAGGELLALAYWNTYEHAHHHHPRRQQHRPLPVSGERGAALHHQRHRRPASARLRRRPAAPPLPVRAGPLRGHRRRAPQGPAGRGLQRGPGHRAHQPGDDRPSSSRCWASPSRSSSTWPTAPATTAATA